MRRFVSGNAYKLLSKETRRGMLVSLFFSCILLVAPIPASAVQSINLIWNPSSSTNIAGYNIYYGGASGSYTNEVVLGNVTNATIPGLREGAIYFFAASAADTSGLESDLS